MSDTDESTKPKRSPRRSCWQVKAARLLKYAVYCGGDGNVCVVFKCWKKWRYVLRPDVASASIILTRSCGHDCQGSPFHSMFTMYL
jgi:hypothetical protein